MLRSSSGLPAALAAPHRPWAEARIGDSVVMIGDARGEHAPTQAMLTMYISMTSTRPISARWPPAPQRCGRRPTSSTATAAAA